VLSTEIVVPWPLILGLETPLILGLETTPAAGLVAGLDAV
jgi:hypothetical protein